MSDCHHYPLRVRIARVEPMAEGVKAIRLVSTSGQSLPPFTAGAHVAVRLQNGLSRSYSITSSDDQCAHYDIAVARDPNSRGGSVFLHDRVVTGDELDISEPRNHFPLHDGHEPAVLIAGGIGITPIWAMVQRLMREGRTWSLHYACRSRERAAFVSELHSAAKASGGRLQLWWDAEHDHAPLNVRDIVDHAPSNSHLYACGPAPMLDAFGLACATRPVDRVHVEHFKPATPSPSGSALQKFKVELARTGQVVEVLEGSTILDSLMMNGIDVPYSCCEGLCGTCETRVIAGVPDHRDNLLTERARQANDAIIICVSRSRSPLLVLDL